MKTRVGIVGYRGYSGAELVGILKRHPHVDPVLLEHRDDAAAGVSIRGAKPPLQLPCDPEVAKKEGLAVVFLATPQDVSMTLAAGMVAAGIKVVDLSGAFRLRTPERYLAWYKETHTQAALLAEAVYGLPEFNRALVPGARLVSNPGCYPTAANLAIKPLVEAGVIDRKAGIVCDAKSGVSGAGRKPSLKTSFCEVTENFSAYSILKHRHVPEVLHHQRLEEQRIQLHGAAHSGATAASSRPSTSAPSGSARARPTFWPICTRSAYAGEPFVRIYNPGQDAGPARCGAHQLLRHRGEALDAARPGAAVVVSAIDNLVKGAAGQAIQNMNLMLGLRRNGVPAVKLLVKLGWRRCWTTAGICARRWRGRSHRWRAGTRFRTKSLWCTAAASR